jgi:hypothetical protein
MQIKKNAPGLVKNFILLTPYMGDLEATKLVMLWVNLLGLVHLTPFLIL